MVTSTRKREVTSDDDRLITALTSLGLSVDLVAWDDPLVVWRDYRLIVVRSTWNYSTQRDRFVRWAYRASRKTVLWNPARTLVWNTDKRYLRDLERAGLPIVPTRWLSKGRRCDLRQVMDQEGWDRVVVKPVVSAGARNTFIVRPRSTGPGQHRLSALLRTRAMMVQPYLASVETAGERSLVFIDGRFSHAIRKVAVLTGGKQSYEIPSVRVTPAQLGLARRTLAACPEPTLYARVDLIRDDHGAWRIGEVELTEPFLFLGSRRDAAGNLAATIAHRLR